MGGTLPAMLGHPRFAILVVLALAVLAFAPRRAAAQARALHVVAIDSDDADEQAEALTSALRSRVRETAGWTLLDTSQSLSVLTAAFQCPQRPDAACLLRIGDKLKADQYLWGVLSKAPGRQVTAEVHLWARGKADQVTRESFSDNLKDANDDGLRKIAAQMFNKLFGITGGSGTLVIHASVDAGSVVIDGAPRGSLDHGRVTVPLAAGPHVVEIQSAGAPAARREVTVAAGSAPTELEVVIDGARMPVATTPTPAVETSTVPVRAIVGWSSVAAGAVLVATGIGFGVSYLGDQSDLNNARQNNYLTGSTTPVADPCNPSITTPATTAGCNAVNSAHRAEIGEITTLAVGGVLAGVGIFLLATDHHASTPAKTGLPSVQVVPSMAAGGGSMLLLGQF